MQTHSANGIQYRRAALSEILPLRHEALIVGTNRTSPNFDGDAAPTTYHFGAFLASETVCCLSMMRTETENRYAYQLRGMATHPAQQGKGIGKNLLSLAEQYIVEHMDICDFWCNARVGMEGFYVKQGWVIVSEPFMIEGVCLHIRMQKQRLQSKT